MLESVYKEAVGSDKSIIEHISYEHISNRKEKFRSSELLDVLENFQVDVV